MRSSWEDSPVLWTSPKKWFVCPPTWNCILPQQDAKSGDETRQASIVHYPVKQICL